MRSHCILNQGLLDLLDQHLSTGLIVERHSHPICVHGPPLDPALRQGPGHLQVSRLAPLVPTQVLKERIALPVLATGSTSCTGGGDDAVAALPEILGMAIGQIGIVPLDAERLKRQHILRERLRATKPGVEIVDFARW
jgi:hypothetical protein